jgi:uncharacterized membrane protein YeiH
VLTPGTTLLLLDLAGVFVFALSGGLTAVRARLDLFGVLVLALTAGLGGGVLRDVLIGAVPPVGVSDWRLITAGIAAGVVTFSWHPRMARTRRMVQLLDAAGLGLFVVAGTLKALEFGAPPIAAVVVGTLTGIGGGILRDVLSGQVPEVLAQGELYATPAIIGAAAFTACWHAGLADGDGKLVVSIAVALGIFLIRVWAVQFNVAMPRAREL